jgi:hypothetical protein
MQTGFNASKRESRNVANSPIFENLKKNDIENVKTANTPRRLTIFPISIPPNRIENNDELIQFAFG